MICKKCGKVFEGRSNRKYCSKQCAHRAKSNRYYHRNKEKGKYVKICLFCKEVFNGTRKTQKYCSVKCNGLAHKKFLSIPDCLENASRKIDKNLGYVRVYAPMHKEANTWGYVYEHRLIAENVIGRKLKDNEIVHHFNGIRWDNREENLLVMDKIEHSKIKS